MGKKKAVWKDKERIIAAFNGAQSKREILSRLDEHLGSSNYAALRHWAKEYNLEVPDGTRYQRRNMPFRSLIPLEEVLVEDSNYSRSSLKKRLLKEGILANCCNVCGQLPEWNGKPLVLQIDHINGISNDNRLENLQIICAHCHSQTDTYCGRNVNAVKLNLKKTGPICNCGNLMAKNSKICNACSGLNRRKIDWPPKEELLDMLAKSNYTQLGKKLGVSDVAIRKHIEKDI